MQWIKCCDKLPEEDSWVLCYLTKNCVEEPIILSLQFYFYKWKESGEIKLTPMFKSIGRSYLLNDITHWMPLPTPPKDE